MNRQHKRKLNIYIPFTVWSDYLPSIRIRCFFIITYDPCNVSDYRSSWKISKIICSNVMAALLTAWRRRSKIEIAVILLSWNIPWRLSISDMTACHVNEKTCSKYCTNRLGVTSWSAEAWISGIMSWVCPLTDTLLILMYISDFAVNNDQGISRDISEKKLIPTSTCVVTIFGNSSAILCVITVSSTLNIPCQDESMTAQNTTDSAQACKSIVWTKTSTS